MNKTRGLLLAAGMVLAMAFTFSGCKEEAKDKPSAAVADTKGSSKVTELKDGEPYSANLSAGDTHLYSVRVERASNIEVKISNAIGVNMEVYTDDGDDVFVYSEDAGYLGFNAGVDKTYFIRLKRNSNKTKGSYGIEAYFHAIPMD